MKSKNLTYCFIFIFAFSCIFFSCNRNKYVMSKSKMEKVIYDLQLSQAIFDTQRNDFQTDEDKKALVESVLKKHGITQQILDSSLVWYSKNMAQLIRINDSVSARLKREQVIWDTKYKEETMLDEKYNESRALASFFYMSKEQPVYSFSIDSLNADKVKLEYFNGLIFKILGASSNIKILSSARFEYSDTSIIVPFVVNEIEYNLSKPEIGRKLEKVSGFVRVESQQPFSLLLYDIHYIQDSIKIVDNLQNDSININ